MWIKLCAVAKVCYQGYGFSTYSIWALLLFSNFSARWTAVYHYITIPWEIVWLSTLSRLVTSRISGMSIQKALGSAVIFHCLARLASVYHREHFTALISLRHNVLSGSMLEHITLFRHQSCITKDLCRERSYCRHDYHCSHHYSFINGKRSQRCHRQ